MTADSALGVELALAVTRAVADYEPTDDTLGGVLDGLLADVRCAVDVHLAEVWLRAPEGGWYRRGVAHERTEAVDRLVQERGETGLEDVPRAEDAIVVHGDPTAVLVHVGRVEQHDAVLILLGGRVDRDPDVVRDVLADVLPSLQRAAHRLVRDLDMRRLAHGTQDLTLVGDLRTTGVWLGANLAVRLGLRDEWLERDAILARIHPEDREDFTAVRAAFRKSAKPRDLMIRLRTVDDGYAVFTWHLWVVADEMRLYGVGREVTEEVRDRAFDQARRRALEGFLDGDGPDLTLERLALALEDRLPGTVVSIERRQVASRRPRLVTAPSMPEDVVGLLANRPFSGKSQRDGGEAAIAVIDITEERAWGVHAPLRARVLDLGLRGRWNVPLVDAAGQWLGSLAAYRPDPAAPNETETDVLLEQAALVTLVLGHVSAEEQRAEEDERFRLLAEATTEAIWDWDLQTDKRWWSPGFGAMFGYAIDELPDDSPGWSDHIHPEDRDAVLESIRRVIDGDADGDEWTTEYRFMHADGSIRWVLDRGRAIRDREGRATRMVGGMLDVTDRYQVDEDQLRLERMESIGVITGGVAHDLNNVLAPIMVAAGMLQREDLDEPLREAAEVIQESAQRGADMIRQILTFVRGAGQQQQLLRIDDVIAGLQRLVRDALAPLVGLEITLPPRRLHVTGDMTQIQQLLVNLAVNARDAMPQGGTVDVIVDEVDVDEAWAVSVPDAAPGRYVRLRVVDTGVGMPPELVDQIFEPFFTTKPPGAGTGLGLSTALAIVRAHEGFITVRSTPGRGTSFAVHLPSARGATEPASTISTPAPVRGDGHTVLIVDDEAAVRTILQQTLVRHGFEAIVAADGAEAVALFAQHRKVVDAVVTDVLMPVMDGIATIRAIRSIEPTVPVVVVSGLIDQERLSALGDLEVQYFLPKPFTAEALLDVVAHLASARPSRPMSGGDE